MGNNSAVVPSKGRLFDVGRGLVLVSNRLLDVKVVAGVGCSQSLQSCVQGWPKAGVDLPATLHLLFKLGKVWEGGCEIKLARVEGLLKLLKSCREVGLVEGLLNVGVGGRRNLVKVGEKVGVLLQTALHLFFNLGEVWEGEVDLAWVEVFLEGFDGGCEVSGGEGLLDVRVGGGRCLFQVWE